MYHLAHRLPHEPWRKPSKNEEEYFHKQEFESRRARDEERAEARRRAQQEAIRESHKDRCPRCGESLEHVRFKEHWADQCPVCGGVWLDREIFDALTHKGSEVLTGIFRYLLLDQTMGRLSRTEMPREAEREPEKALR